MPKFAIGDVVDKDKTHSGTVIAVFKTVEGEQRYAVDMEGYGALQFIMECNLVPHETPQGMRQMPSWIRLIQTRYSGITLASGGRTMTATHPCVRPSQRA